MNDRTPGGDPATLTRIAIGVCGFVIVAAITVLVGWVIDSNVLRSLIPDTVSMKASTATMFVLGATSLACRLAPDGHRATSRVARACAAVTLVIALAFLVEYVFGTSLGIDEIPFRDHEGRALGIAYPGRLAPTTAAAFVALAGMLLTFDRPRWERLSRALALVIAVPAAMTLIGYAYDIPAFYGPDSAAKMALPTGVLLLLVVMAALWAHPGGKVRALMAARDPGSVMIRRLIPGCIVGPLILGWIRLLGIDHELFNDRVGTWFLTTATVVVLCMIVVRSARHLRASDAERAALATALEHLASHDSLTALFNRRRFEEELEREIVSAMRYGETGALLMIDLDDFKSINDTHGHGVGDDLLRSVGDALVASVRASDTVGRLGGDEFVVFLSRTSAADAVRIAEALLARIAAITLPHEAPNTTTASIGVATTRGRTTSSLLHVADMAMYAAKQAGGDQVAATAAVQEEVRTAASLA